MKKQEKTRRALLYIQEGPQHVNAPHTISSGSGHWWRTRGRYYVEVTDECLTFFKQLSRVVHGAFKEEILTARSQHLKAVARGAVKTNYCLQSKFHPILQHDDTMVTQLIQEISN